ncbi:MAG: bifunctional folylpolyglutamate synthase/dihydrofolate synthase [Draconibacterium sp.]
MNYNETLDYLFTRLPMFQRTGPAAYKNTLANTLLLDELYGHPYQQFKTVHVAGTNGKGSVSHMLASVFQTAGYKTGLYTSPHLKDFRERIRINGKMMAEEDVVNWVENYETNNQLWKIEPSFFELTVAMAFDYFAQQKVDVAIIEVGLGGRLDSTNIITPEISIITNIGLDHTNLLGETLEAIAGEKAGIIKENIPVVIGETQAETKAVFLQKAKEKKAPVYFADQEFEVTLATRAVDGLQNLQVDKNGKAAYRDLKVDLMGFYQHKNLPAVLKAVEILNQKAFEITESALRTGLKQVKETTGLQGRWQVIGANPMVVCDTGHNFEGMKEVVQQINFTPYKNLHIVFGTVGDKNPDKVLGLLPKNAKYYFVKADIERALDIDVLKQQAAAFGLVGDSYSSVNEGFKKALEAAGENDLVFVGGSTFVVAEIL